MGDGIYSCGTPQQDIQEELAPAGTKQDSWDMAKILLKSHCEAPNHSVAKLHKIKNILNDVCSSMGQDKTKCNCRQVCGFIKTYASPPSPRNPQR